jgi:hypothetical protein
MKLSSLSMVAALLEELLGGATLYGNRRGQWFGLGIPFFNNPSNFQLADPFGQRSFGSMQGDNFPDRFAPVGNHNLHSPLDLFHQSAQMNFGLPDSYGTGHSAPSWNVTTVATFFVVIVTTMELKVKIEKILGNAPGD